LHTEFTYLTPGQKDRSAVEGQQAFRIQRAACLCLVEEAQHIKIMIPMLHKGMTLDSPDDKVLIE
jgi:hypothetical protein